MKGIQTGGTRLTALIVCLLVSTRIDAQIIQKFPAERDYDGIVESEVTQMEEDWLSPLSVGSKKRIRGRTNRYDIHSVPLHLPEIEEISKKERILQSVTKCAKALSLSSTRGGAAGRVKGNSCDGESDSISRPPIVRPTNSPVVSPISPVPSNVSTEVPSMPSPAATNDTLGVTYFPGDLNGGPCNDGRLTLSTGMGCALLTTAGEFVQLADGTTSSVPFHQAADGATVIPHPTDGGWYYVSNSESTEDGGVGSIQFDAQGRVVGYERNLIGTKRNCGGGRTYWGTWISCEENAADGLAYEVDPVTGFTQLTRVVDIGGNYESFAFDNEDPEVPGGARFFVTEDNFNGALIRYTPSISAFQTGNQYDILSSPGGTYEFLVLHDNSTFVWSSDRQTGENSATRFFPYSEGIDCFNRMLNFVSKTTKRLITLDLEAGTWTSSSTQSGAFNLGPDQLGRILGDEDTLYFCEDGGADCDVHARDSNDRYYTIVRGDGHITETTGLAFSPDNMFMYVSFQLNSNIYAFWRLDELPFDGDVADIKYH